MKIRKNNEIIILNESDIKKIKDYLLTEARGFEILRSAFGGLSGELHALLNNQSALKEIVSTMHKEGYGSGRSSKEIFSEFSSLAKTTEGAKGVMREITRHMVKEGAKPELIKVLMQNSSQNLKKLFLDFYGALYKDKPNIKNLINKAAKEFPSKGEAAFKELKDDISNALLNSVGQKTMQFTNEEINIISREIMLDAKKEITGGGKSGRRIEPPIPSPPGPGPKPVPRIPTSGFDWKGWLKKGLQVGGVAALAGFIYKWLNEKTDYPDCILNLLKNEDYQNIASTESYDPLVLNDIIDGVKLEFYENKKVTVIIGSDSFDGSWDNVGGELIIKIPENDMEIFIDCSDFNNVKIFVKGECVYGCSGTTPPPPPPTEKCTPLTDSDDDESLILNGSKCAKSGSRGPLVQKIQSMLSYIYKNDASGIGCKTNINDDTFYQEDCDGKFGSNTKSAAEKFQKDNGLSADGVVGKETYAKLLSVYNNMLERSKKYKPIELEPIKPTKIKTDPIDLSGLGPKPGKVPAQDKPKQTSSGQVTSKFGTEPPENPEDLFNESEISKPILDMMRRMNILK